MFFTELLSMTHSAKYEVERIKKRRSEEFHSEVCKSCELAKQLKPMWSQVDKEAVKSRRLGGHPHSFAQK